MITLTDLHSAQSRIQGITKRTNLIEFQLCAEDPRRLLLKPENQQPIGSSSAEPTTRSLPFHQTNAKKA